MTAIQIIAIVVVILAVIAMNYLPVKGWNITIVSFGLAIICALVNAYAMPPLACVNTGLTIVGTIMGTMLPLFVFGAVLGEIYNRSNASVTIARIICAPFKNVKNERTKAFLTILLILVVRAILGLAGFNNIAIMPLMIAIVGMVFARCNYPRKYVATILLIAGEIQILVPGVPTTEMVLLEQYIPGFTRTTMFVPRLIILLVYIFVAALIMMISVRKDADKGIGWEQGNMRMIADIDTKEKCPNIILTLIPLVAIYVTFAILKWDAWLSLIIGVVCAVLCLGWYIKGKSPEEGRGASILNTINEGAFKLPLAICGCMLFGIVMTFTDAWMNIQNWLGSLPVHPAILMAILAIIITLATGTQGAAPILGSVFASVCLPAGLSPAAAGIIILVGYVCLDTVPNNIGLIMQCDLTDTTVKATYPSVFKTTVALSLGIAVVVTVLSIVKVFG